MQRSAIFTVAITCFLVCACAAGDDDLPPASDAQGTSEAATPAVAGFGQSCSDIATPCPGDLTCLRQQGQPTGYCSQKCSSFGDSCPGTAPGTRADCLFGVKGSGQYLCAFRCGPGIACPPGLKCFGAEDEQALGQCALP